jgi:SAM-dependent MidA family methyltransferase
MAPPAASWARWPALLAKGRGAAILVDYGFPGARVYHPDRSAGTLMCHYRHHAHPDPFYLPGLQDITAHVDFTAMALAAHGRRRGGAGLHEPGAVPARRPASATCCCAPIRRTSQSLPAAANAVHKLLSPAEMGELFKVLVVGKDVRCRRRSPPATGRTGYSRDRCGAGQAPTALLCTPVSV